MPRVPLDKEQKRRRREWLIILVTILFIIVLIITLIQFRLAGRWVYYESGD